MLPLELRQVPGMATVGPLGFFSCWLSPRDTGGSWAPGSGGESFWESLGLWVSRNVLSMVLF